MFFYLNVSFVCAFLRSFFFMERFRRVIGCLSSIVAYIDLLMAANGC